MNLEYKCFAENNNLSNSSIINIRDILKSGGLCILPSDSSYILTGYVTLRDVSNDIDCILNRKGMPMSLAFGNLPQIEEWIDLSNRAHLFLKKITPGGVTLVAKAKKKTDLIRFSKRFLHADGTVGFRITESQVETQLASLYPLPTTPIRNDDSKETDSLDEAIAAVERHLAQTNININRKIVAIEGNVPYPGRLSTVVKEEFKEGYWNLTVLREGAVSSRLIKKLALECGYMG